jgi:hypothetical protein
MKPRRLYEWPLAVAMSLVALVAVWAFGLKPPQQRKERRP